MTAQELIAAQRASPFRPFMIRLADGRKLVVPHPEFLSVSPRGRTAIVWQRNDSLEIVDVMLVLSIQFGNGQARQRRRGNGGSAA